MIPDYLKQTLDSLLQINPAHRKSLEKIKKICNNKCIASQLHLTKKRYTSLEKITQRSTK